MTSTARYDVDGLRGAMTGAVVLPGEAGFDDARSIWNGAIDRKPALIARCRTAGDVAAAVTFGRDNSLEIAVRGGGHGFAGTAVCDDGLMIDLSLLNGVRVHPDERRAVVGGGATLADLDAATQAHGLAVTGGVISHTGVGGLTLGGGMGWLVGRCGLSLDNLVGAQVVLADGRIVHAAERDHADLFWALRGGGGNFGVVTEFEFALHEVGPEVHLGLLFWGLDQGREALRACRDSIPGLPETSGVLIAAAMNAPPAPFVPPEHHFAPGHALMVVGFDGAEEHDRSLDAVRRACPPLFEFVTPLPYVALQGMLDDSAPWGMGGYEKALYLDDLTDDAVDVLATRAGEKRSPLTFAPIFVLDGAYSRVGDDDTAYGGRRRRQYVVNLAAVGPDLAAPAVDRDWARSLWDELRPLAEDGGGYVNFMADADADRVRASYGAAKYERLAHIKAEYDPGNLFHRNANIKPA